MIAVIDYGLGNLRSVSSALEAAGAKRVEVTNNPIKIADAKAIILPGVGAFSRGMENLAELNIIPVIHKAVDSGKFLLGICLGLQLLFTKSEEHKISPGLNIVKGRVIKFSVPNIKVPHIGWNKVKLKEAGKKSKLFEGIEDNSYFYFVHSYYVVPENPEIISAITLYGEEFTSVIISNNIIGVQFHPERSGEIGIKLFKNFLSLIK